ncbi:hypothetical protein P9112_006351 [Eukaryota sp. TZLM1-RC]
MSYSNKVKIGNYFEDRCNDEIKVQSFLQKLQSGDLEFMKEERKRKRITAPVELTSSRPDVVSFEDVIQISTQDNQVLSVFPDDTAIPTAHSCTVSLTTQSSPCVRNAFRVVRDEDAMNQYIADFDDRFPPNDPILRFGQKFHLLAHQDLSTNPNPNPNPNQLVLYSEPKSFTAFSRVSNNQILCVRSPRKIYSSFYIAHHDPELRLEMEGEPVPRGSPLLLIHAQTGKGVVVGKDKVCTDLGSDLEVYCDNIGRASLFVFK